MNILVAFATRHGSTRAIAETIAAELEACGHRTVFLGMPQVTSLDGYDAVVAGSDVHHGRWLDPARRFLDRFQPELATLPTWLFSSGKIGELPASGPHDVTSRRDAIRLKGHRCFARRPEWQALGLDERIRARLDGSAEADLRDWARHIGRELGPVPIAATGAAALRPGGFA